MQNLADVVVEGDLLRYSMGVNGDSILGEVRVEGSRLTGGEHFDVNSPRVHVENQSLERDGALVRRIVEQDALRGRHRPP
jgi:hypothetical protein